jgi:hypothetical protein
MASGFSIIVNSTGFTEPRAVWRRPEFSDLLQ